MLNLNVGHTFLFENTMVIRTGLPEVDLLQGGAIGVGGGQQRHIGNASVALTRGGTGIRLFATWQGSSFLQSGSLAAPDLITFKTLAKFDLRAFADLGQLFPKSKLAKGTRVSLAVENIGNSRLDVFNSVGAVPLGFQPVYRDPVGRTVSFELRKVF